ncbi:MAG: hypothetical protein LBQ54_13855 [Planctomycetaceae bacterium]|nr:hypothetical protein [Planctomycetaceae bacterium]
MARSRAATGGGLQLPIVRFTLFRSQIPATIGSGSVAFGAGNVRTLHPGLPSASSGKIFLSESDRLEEAGSKCGAACHAAARRGSRRISGLE